MQNLKLSEKQVFGVLSYLPFFCVAIFILKNDDSFIKFHSKQGIVLFGIFLLSFLPLLGSVALLVFLCACIVGASKASKGEKYKIPYLYKLSEHIDF
jgi:uncharacterized membrane protein